MSPARYNGSMRLLRAPIAAAAFAAALLLGGCASLEGARLYESGTEALERGEAALAAERLERAAVLVPQASEVQNHLGLAYAAAGREADALRAFRRAVALDCANAAAAENLAAAEARAAAAPRTPEGPGAAVSALPTAPAAAGAR